MDGNANDRSATHSVSPRSPKAPVRSQDPGLARPKISFHRSEYAFLDRVLPTRTRPFFAVVLGVAVAIWLLGLALAADRGRYVTTAEWLVQPLYLAVHLVLLRAFVTAYATHFAGGCKHLKVGRAEVDRRMRSALDWKTLLAALAITAPLLWVDVRWHLADVEFGLGAGRAFAAGDLLILAVWGVEWLVNAYIWALIVAFLYHTVVVLRRYEYRDPIERVLRERQYRPFLLMSGQAASLTIVFAAANAAYVYLTRGSTSDYLGLWATAGLVLFGFVPAWLLLKSRIGAAVAVQADTLSERIDDAALARPASGPQEIVQRLEGMTAILRLDYLDRLHRDLGKVEAQATILKLLAPALTAGWRLFKPF